MIWVYNGYMRNRRRTYRTEPWKRFWQRKLPMGLITLWWWVLWGVLVLKVPPVLVANIGLEGGYLIFFIFLGLSVIFTLSLILKTFWRSLVWGGLMVTFMALRLLHLGTWFNLTLLVLLGLAVELYFFGDRGRMKTSSQESN